MAPKPVTNHKPVSAAQINIFEFLDFRAFLNASIVARKKDNPHFSVRMVAYHLGCNPGFFNRVLKGTRNLSGHYLIRLSEFLKLNGKQRHYFELLVNFNQARNQAEKDHFFKQLDIFRSSKVKETSVAQHAMYAQWYVIVLRELMNFLPCKGMTGETFSLIAKHLEPRVSLEQIRTALVTLDESGLLSRKKDGTFAVNERFITSGADIPQVVVNRVLLQFMDLAKVSVDRFTRKERSLSTLTFSVSERGYERIREKLDQYRRDILSIVNEEDEDIDRVYHLNLHLFPVTKPYRGKSK
jgi:uncharacterized protein (TIGR02147 family)